VNYAHFLWLSLGGFLALVAGFSFWAAKVDRAVKQLSPEEQTRLKYAGFFPASLASGLDAGLLGGLSLIGISTIINPEDTANWVAWIKTQDYLMNAVVVLAVACLVIASAASAVWHFRKVFDRKRTSLFRQYHTISFIYRTTIILGSAAFMANNLK
jgi:hypothetical protein